MSNTPKLRRKRRATRSRQIEAAKDFAARLAAALECFQAEDRPLWKRTQDGMLAFKGLPMDTLPPRLEQDIERRFSRVNDILAGYDIETWDDYARIAEEDLHRIQELYRGFVTDP